MTRTCHPSIGLRHTQVGHVVPRIRTAQPLAPAFIKWLSKRQCSYLRVRASLWMRSEVPARTFQGEGQCAVPKKRNLDRWLKGSTLEEVNPCNGQGFGPGSGDH